MIEALLKQHWVIVHQSGQIPRLSYLLINYQHLAISLLLILLPLASLIYIDNRKENLPKKIFFSTVALLAIQYLFQNALLYAYDPWLNLKNTWMPEFYLQFKFFFLTNNIFLLLAVFSVLLIGLSLKIHKPGLSGILLRFTVMLPVFSLLLPFLFRLSIHSMTIVHDILMDPNLKLF